MAVCTTQGEDNEEFVVTVPALPGVTARADTVYEAQYRITEAIARSLALTCAEVNVELHVRHPSDG